MAYDGKRVLVIGGGNSAAELCVELRGTAQVTCAPAAHRYFSDTGELDHIRGSSESVLRAHPVRILGLREGDPAVSVNRPPRAFRSGGGGDSTGSSADRRYRPLWLPVSGVL